MPDSWFSLSVTDSALAAIRSTQRDHIRAVDAIAQDIQRTARGRLGKVDEQQVLRQATLLRYVSTVEAYVDSLSTQLLFDRIVDDSPNLRVLVQEIERSSSSNWGERSRSFKTVHGVSLSDMDGWSEIDAARDARNSVAHGLGRLTASQRRNTGLRKKLRKIGIEINGGYLVISDRSLEVLATAAEDFVVSLDKSVG